MNEEGIERVTKLIKRVKAGGGVTHSVTITARQRQLTTFISTVSTHTEYQGYRYYRNRGSNDHMVREGNDQSINYFAKTVVKLLNNCFKRQDTFAFFSAYGKIILQHYEGKYYLNGNRLTKTRLNSCVPGILMKLAISKDSEKFSNFVDMIIETDPKISSAIVNKIEYTFFADDKKITTLLNLEKTGKEHSAIELYEGVWVEFKDTRIKSFINSCRGNKNKFLGVSPEELYYLSRGEFLSKSETQIVYAFLEQNRKSSLVEKRSMELFKDLTERFKGKIFERAMIIDEDEKQSMAVRGKNLDWMVVDRGYKAGRQDVSTYAVICASNFKREEVNNRPMYIPNEGTGLNNIPVDKMWSDKNTKKKYYLIGPICIDQAHTGISIGDQFAARSMALLNDVHTFSQVSTLRGYERYKVKNRVDWDALSVLFQ
tara:strand:- start:2838 stop:4121 length:1284 start_codon:yes stop_codon:yes gene_type:complete